MGDCRLTSKPPRQFYQLGEYQAVMELDGLNLIDGAPPKKRRGLECEFPPR